LIGENGRAGRGRPPLARVQARCEQASGRGRRERGHRTGCQPNQVYATRSRLESDRVRVQARCDRPHRGARRSARGTLLPSGHVRAPDIGLLRARWSRRKRRCGEDL